MNVQVVTPTGERSGEVLLDDAIFGVKVNVVLMHQVVVAQLAAARAGTHSTKTRGQVRGGGAKPWRQKGTGRARHGSIREPQWKGGGVAWGPHPRDHSVSVPKKMKALALRSALSDRAREQRIVVVDGFQLSKPKTKDAVAALKAWSVDGKVLVVLTTGDENVAYSFRNLPRVHVLAEDQLNVYDVLNADHLIFSKAALEAFQARHTVKNGEATNGEATNGEGNHSGGVRGAAAPSPDSPPATEPTEQEPSEAREAPRSTGEEAS